MSFKRLDPEDFIISSDSVTAPLWTGGSPSLSTFVTSSVQEAGSSGDFYLNVYQTASDAPNAEVQFAISYGNKQGSGSILYNSAINGYSPTRSTYGQYRNLVLGSETSDFVFGGATSSDFWVISIDRNRYKQSLLPGTMTLVLSSSGGSIRLTDDSLSTSTVVFNDAGRVFQIISGSAGVPYKGLNNFGYSATGSYGLFLPDIGTILLHPTALSSSIKLDANRTSNSDGLNYQKLLVAMSGGAALGGLPPGFTANSQETISSDYIFVRSRNAEFNYSENPSFISGSTGEVIFNSFINNPQTFPTTIGLYNDNNELLAVAKLSRPLLKDFTKEALVRVKLDF